jgi:hypothetical protein
LIGVGACDARDGSGADSILFVVSAWLDPAAVSRLRKAQAVRGGSGFAEISLDLS